MFRRILVAVDGSPHASHALTQAIDLAMTANAQLTVMTAAAQVPASVYLADGAPIELMMADARAEAEAVVQEALLRIPPDLRVEAVLSDRPIRTALIRQIKAGEHDLVLVGSRGLGAVRSSLLGSVSHYVLNHSPAPVMVVRAQRSLSRGPATGRSLPRAGLESRTLPASAVARS